MLPSDSPVSSAPVSSPGTFLQTFYVLLQVTVSPIISLLVAVTEYGVIAPAKSFVAFKRRFTTAFIRRRK